MMEEEKKDIEIVENSEEKKPTSRKKTIGLILIVLLITVVVFVIFSSFNDLGKTWEQICNMDFRFLGIGIALVVLYLISWPLSLMILSRRNLSKSKIKDNFLIGGSEHFFNSITPFASGGQPIQIYLYTQNGMSAANATGIVLSNFIAFMIATNAFAVASLFYFDRFTVNFNGSTIWIVILGFTMNLLTLAFIIALASSKKLGNLLIKAFAVLGKIKFLTKVIEKNLPTFEQYCSNFQLASKEIMSHKLDFLLAIVARGVSLLFYYSIPFFILLGLGISLEFTDLPFIILASSFTITTMVWVPTPGGTGGIEFAFTMIVSVFVIGLTDSELANITMASMIIWRFLTYYLLMFLSAIEYIIYEIIIKKRRKRSVKEND